MSAGRSSARLADSHSKCFPLSNSRRHSRPSFWRLYAAAAARVGFFVPDDYSTVIICGYAVTFASWKGEISPCLRLSRRNRHVLILMTHAAAIENCTAEEHPSA